MLGAEAVIRHTVEPVIGLVAFLGGLTANAVAAWGAVLVYLAFLWRDRLQEARHRQAERCRCERLQAVVDATNTAAITRGERPPYPEYMPPSCSACPLPGDLPKCGR